MNVLTTFYDASVIHRSIQATVSISPGQRNLMKTFHNEANTNGITKIASIFFFFFEVFQSK